MQELDPARPHLANRLLKQPSSEGGCCAASLPAPAASASDATVRYRRACAAPPPQQPDRACAPSQPLCAVRMLSFALGGMELSRERCGKQCTKWRRQAWRRRRQGERGGRGRRVWTAAVLMLPPRRFCARAGGSAVLCCAVKLWGARSGAGSTRACGTQSPFPVLARSLPLVSGSTSSGRLLRGALLALRPAVAPSQPLPAGGALPRTAPGCSRRGFHLSRAVLTTRGNGHRIDEFTRSLAVGRWAGAAVSVPFRDPGRAP